VKRQEALIFFLIVCAVLSHPCGAAESGTLKTRYATIHYQSPKDLSEFTWRISGQRIEFPADLNTGDHSVDRIVDRVQSILDMYPNSFGVVINLLVSYTSGDIAAYDKKSRTIEVYADRVTDGVLAHEISHAVIDAYFESTPPDKVHEILSRYVDQHLWSDYEP
jgi:hypothetical protein